MSYIKTDKTTNKTTDITSNKLTNGIFIVTDGLDGIGKGVVNKAIEKYFINLNKRILDVHDFWKKHDNHPDFENKMSSLYVNLNDFDVILTSEPTYVGVGKMIREEITAKNNRTYSAHITADAYSMDREILLKRVVIPALKMEKIVLQSRSVSTSIVYQTLQELLPEETPLSINDIIKLEGNALALKYRPDLLIIPTIKDPKMVIQRLENRKKQDNSVFEKIDFQMKIKPFYESDMLKEIFESRGTKVQYMDVSTTEDKTNEQALSIIKEFFKTKGL